MYGVYIRLFVNKKLSSSSDIILECNINVEMSSRCEDLSLCEYAILGVKLRYVKILVDLALGSSLVMRNNSSAVATEFVLDYANVSDG